MCRTDRSRPNPWLLAGVLMNTIYLLLDHMELSFFHSGSNLLCCWEGVALGLMLLGLILCRPERAEAIRAWKKARLPALFH